jgi:hypothetical protein
MSIEKTEACAREAPNLRPLGFQLRRAAAIFVRFPGQMKTWDLGLGTEEC